MSNSEALRVRLPDTLAKEFAAYAKENDTTRSRILRKIVSELVAQKPDLLPEEIKAFRHAARQLSGACTNLNQLTRRVNAGEIHGEVVEGVVFLAVKCEVQNLTKKLRDYIYASKTRWR